MSRDSNNTGKKQSQALEALHNNKAFAMLHCASAIGGTEWEGMNPIEACQYLIDMLTLENPCTPYPFIDQSHRALALEALQDIIEFQKLFNTFPANNLGAIVDFKLVTDLLHKRIEIKKSHKNKKAIVYMPGGWVGEPGHFIAIKLQWRKNNEYLVSYLQQGAGCQYHRPMKKGQYKVKYCYESDPVIINLDSKLGQQFLTGIVSFKIRIDSQANQKHYNADDLYGLLNLSGKLDDSFEPDPRQAVTPQRVGSCALTNAKIVVTDMLINYHDYPANKIKNITFALKLNSLYVANEAYKTGHCNHKLLEWALRESSVRAVKLYPEVISDFECKKSLELVNNVVLRSEKELTIALPSSTGKIPAVERVRTKIGESDKPCEKGENSLQKKRDFKKVPSDISPDQLCQVVNKFHSVDLLEIYQFILSLPKTSGMSHDEFWDAIPAEDRLPLLEKLSSLLFGHSVNKKKILNIYKFSSALIIYDIAAQMAIAMPELALDGRFSLGLGNIIPSTMQFTDPVVFYCVKEIILRFQKRCFNKSIILTDWVTENSQDKTVEFVRTKHLSTTTREIIKKILVEEKRVDQDEEVSDSHHINIMLTGYLYALGHNVFGFRIDTTKFMRRELVAMIKASAVAHRLGYGISDQQERLRLGSSMYTPRPRNEQETVNLRFTDGSISDREHSLAHEVLMHGNPDYTQKMRREPGGVKLSYLPKKKRLPNDLVDFAENTAFLPAEHQHAIIKKEAEYEQKSIKDKYGIKRTPPFQHKFGGTFQVGHESWNITEDNQNLEVLDEELRCIEAARMMRISLLLEWLPTHFTDLGMPEIRARVFELFFEFGYLDYALTWHLPEIINQLNKVMQAGFNYCIERIHGRFSRKTHDIFQFFTELQLYLAEYTAFSIKLYGQKNFLYKMVDIRSQILEAIKKCPDAELNSKYMKLFIAMHDLIEPKNWTELRDLMRIKILLAMSPPDLSERKKLNHLEIMATTAWNKHVQYAPHFLTGDDIQRKAIELLQGIIGFDSINNWRFENNLLYGSINNVIILILNIDTGQIIAHGQNVVDQTAMILKSISPLKLPIHDLGEIKFHNFGNIDGSKEVLYKSSDGKWELTLSNDAVSKAFINILMSVEGIQFESTYQVVLNHDESFAENISILFEKHNMINPFPIGKYFFAYSDEEIFVMPLENQNQGFLHKFGYGWMILNKNEDGVWEDSGLIRLDLNKPFLPIESEWQEALDQSIGYSGVSVTARKFANTVVLHSLTWPAFNLSFTNDKDQLACDQFPGFYWLKIERLEVFPGLQILIVLENDNGERKFLLPPFQLKNVDTDESGKPKNKALSTEKWWDVDACLENSKCFEYELNRHRELVGTSDEANLYLSILYRCSGDYERAMQALKLSESWMTNTKLQYEITCLTQYWPDRSALGAAFDCQLAMRLYRHSGKWSKAGDYWSTTGKSPINTHFLEQYELYKKHISARKSDVNIMPEYIRLNPEEHRAMASLESLMSDEDDKKTKDKPSSRSNAYVKRLYDESNIGHSNQARTLLEDCEDWIKGLEGYKKMPSECPFSLRANDGSAYSRLCAYFLSLFKEAIDENEETRQALLVKLFLLAGSDSGAGKESKKIISLLLVVLQNHQEFSRMPNKTFHNTGECVRAILSYGEDLLRQEKLNTEPVVPVQDDTYALEEQKPLPAMATPKSNLEIKKIAVTEQGFTFSELAEKYLRVENASVITDSFISEMPLPSSKIGERIVRRLQVGNEQNKTRAKKRFVWICDSNDLSKLRDKLKIIKENNKNEPARLNNDIVTVGNQVSHQEEDTKAYFMHEQRAKLRRKITSTDLFNVLLTGDIQHVMDINPYLDQEHIDFLINAVQELAFQQIRLDQIDAMLRIIGKHNSLTELTGSQQQALARILSTTRFYEVDKYPECLIYEYATKRILREDQINIIRELIQFIEDGGKDPSTVRQMILQFAAGGGKTSVLVPILAARIKRMGMLPVIMNTSEMYRIAINEIPQNLRNSFLINVEVIERGLDHKWTSQELEQLLRDLNQWKGIKCLLMVTEAWHSINTSKYMAYEENNERLVVAADQVLAFFQQDAFMLEDEGQVSSSPKQVSIKTHGPMQKLSMDQQELFLLIFQHLLGIVPESREIADLAGIARKNKDFLLDEELERLQSYLTGVISSFNKFSDLGKDVLKQYLLQKNKRKPSWLHALRKDKSNVAGLVVAARGFIQTLLPHILTLQYNTNFGKSTHPGDLTAAPKRNGDALDAHFADQLLVLALSIILHHIAGIPSKQVENIIDEFMKQHDSEDSDHTEMSHAEQQINSLFPKESGFISLSNLSDERRRELCESPMVQHHYPLMRYFLLTKVFVQIGTPKYRVVSSSSNYQAGFNKRISFSATPGLVEMYFPTVKKENYKELLSFEAEVVATLLHGKNAEYCLLDMTTDPTLFFRQIKEGHPEFFRKMQTLIDSGALVSDLDPALVTKSLLELLEHDDLRQTTLHFKQGEGEMQLFSKIPALHEKTAGGTNVAAILNRYGIKAEQILIFLFLDLCRTTGTDVVRPQNDRAALTIGKGQTLAVTIQAAMRERLLLEEDSQTVMWLLFKNLYHKISSDVKFDLRKILPWLIGNDVNEIENGIVSRIYQVVDQVLLAAAEVKLRNKLIQYEDIRSIIQKAMLLDPYMLYEIETREAAPREIIENYIQEQCGNLKIDFNKDISTEGKELLEQIILDAENLFDSLTTPHSSPLESQVLQEQNQQAQEEQQVQQQQQQHIKQRTLINVGDDFRFNIEYYSQETDGLATFLEAGCYKAINLGLGNQGIKYPDIIINYGHFQPFMHLERSSSLSFLKPIQALLVVLKPETGFMKFVGCTAAGIQYFESQMRHQFSGKEIVFFLVGKQGNILCSTPNASEASSQMLIESELLQEALCFSAFLNGEVRSVPQLANLVKKYRWSKHEYNILVDAVTNLHVSRSTIAIQSIPRFDIYCGWIEPVLPVVEFTPIDRKMGSLPVASVTLGAPLVRCTSTRIDTTPHSVLSSALYGEPLQVFAYLEAEKSSPKIVHDLLNAIKNGDVLTIKEYCNDGQNLSKLLEVMTMKSDNTGDHTITIAAKNNQSELVRFLLEKSFGYPETRALLIGKLTEENREGKNVLHETAITPNNEEIITLLCNAAKILCARGVTENLKELANFVNLRDKQHGNTPLHHCVKHCCFSNFLALRAAGASISTASNNGMNPLDIIQYADPRIAVPFMRNFILNTEEGARSFFKRHSCRHTDLDPDVFERIISIDLDIMLKDNPAAQCHGYKETMQLMMFGNDLQTNACIPNIGHINFACITEDQLQMQKDESGSMQVLARALKDSSMIDSPDLKNLFIRADILWQLKGNTRATKEAFDYYGTGELLEKHPKLALQRIKSLDSSFLNKDILAKRIILACTYIHLSALQQADVSGITNLFNVAANKLKRKTALIQDFSNDLRNVISVKEMLDLVSQLPIELKDLKDNIFSELRKSHLLVVSVDAIKVEPKK